MGCGCTSGYDGKMSCKCKSNMRLVQLGILFFILANPETYKYTLGQTQLGVFAHALVFLAIFYFFM